MKAAIIYSSYGSYQQKSDNRIVKLVNLKNPQPPKKPEPATWVKIATPRIIEINSLQELIDLQKAEKHPLVINPHCYGDNVYCDEEVEAGINSFNDFDLVIEVYNDYRE